MFGHIRPIVKCTLVSLNVVVIISHSPVITVAAVQVLSLLDSEMFNSPPEAAYRDAMWRLRLRIVPLGGGNLD